jgi:AhpD family alkylhydroperoxidase
MSNENARVKLLERDSVTPEAAALYDALLAQRGVVPNMFKVLAYSPDIAKGVAGFLKPLLRDGALPGWYKELIAVRVSILCESEYAIRAHSISAQKKGASQPRSRQLLILKMDLTAKRKSWVFALPNVCMVGAAR